MKIINKSREIVPTEENKEHKEMVKHYKASVAIAYYMLINERGKIK